MLAGFASPFWGKIQEIRDAVIEFKKSENRYSRTSNTTAIEYYMAIAADKVFLMPSAPLDLTGVAHLRLFLRGPLDKVGVTRICITSANTRPR